MKEPMDNITSHTAARMVRWYAEFGFLVAFTAIMCAAAVAYR